MWRSGASGSADHRHGQAGLGGAPGAFDSTFASAHTVTVDTTRGLLFCNGTKLRNCQAAGMHILSLADPRHPVEIGTWPRAGTAPDSLAGYYYVHDCDPKGNLLFLSVMDHATHLNPRIVVLDTSNPSQPIEIGSWTYSGADETHSTAIDVSGRYLYSCDEGVNQPLRDFDLVNGYVSPPIVSDYRPAPRPELSLHVVHNPRVKGNDLYVASYAEGIRLLDIADPAHPAEFGYADTRPPGNSPNYYTGVWEVCPQFPSGIAIASDDVTGLWVFRAKHDYGVLRVTVVYSGSLQPVAGAQVQLAPSNFQITKVDGVARFAPVPGNYSVSVTKSGYSPASFPHTVAIGSNQNVTVALSPSGGCPSGNCGGGEPIGGGVQEDCRDSRIWE